MTLGETTVLSATLILFLVDVLEDGEKYNKKNEN